MSPRASVPWLNYLLGLLCVGAIVAAILVVGPASGSQTTVTRTAKAARRGRAVDGVGQRQPAGRQPAQSRLQDERHSHQHLCDPGTARHRGPAARRHSTRRAPKSPSNRPRPPCSRPKPTSPRRKKPTAKPRPARAAQRPARRPPPPRWQRCKRLDGRHYGLGARGHDNARRQLDLARLRRARRQLPVLQQHQLQRQRRPRPPREPSHTTAPSSKTTAPGSRRDEIRLRRLVVQGKRTAPRRPKRP